MRKIENQKMFNMIPTTSRDESSLLTNYCEESMTVDEHSNLQQSPKFKLDSSQSDTASAAAAPNNFSNSLIILH